MNELIFFLTIFIYFTLTLTAHKLFGKTGLYVWVAISILYANIEVLLLVNTFNVQMTLGNVIYGSTFLATDILNELYGSNSAKKAVKIGFFTSISMIILSQLTILYVPDVDDFARESFNTLFNVTPRIVLASSITYVSSQFFDIWVYQKIKDFTNSRYLWLRNNLSTFLSQLIDTVVFTLIAFYGIFEFDAVLALIIPTFLIKLVVSIFDTPFFYLAIKMNKKLTGN